MSRSRGGKAPNATEVTVVLEKNLNLALWDLHVLGSAGTGPESVPSWRATSRVCAFLESRLRDEQVKLTEKMGDHLTAAGRPPGALRAELREGLTLQCNCGPRSPAGVGVASACPRC